LYPLPAKGKLGTRTTQGKKEERIMIDKKKNDRSGTGAMKRAVDRGEKIERQERIICQSPSDRVYGIDPVTKAGAHEAGHALAAWSACYVTSLLFITVKEDGSGTTRTEWSRSSTNAEGVRWEMMLNCLGGIAAEATVYGRFRSGECRGDLATARELAEKISETEQKDGCRTDAPWPMSKPMRVDLALAFSDHVPFRVREILNEGYARACAIMRGQGQRLAALARAASEKRHLEEKEINAILGPRPWTAFVTR
jgi:ATP-dependent Zn protease